MTIKINRKVKVIVFFMVRKNKQTENAKDIFKIINYGNSKKG